MEQCKEITLQYTWSEPISPSDEGLQKLYDIACAQLTDPSHRHLIAGIVKGLEQSKSEFSLHELRKYLEDWVVTLAIAGCQELPLKGDKIIERVRKTSTPLSAYEYGICTLKGNSLEFSVPAIQEVHNHFYWDCAIPEYHPVLKKMTELAGNVVMRARFLRCGVSCIHRKISDVFMLNHSIVYVVGEEEYRHGDEHIA